MFLKAPTILTRNTHGEDHRSFSSIIDISTAYWFRRFES
ncbi:hypothetical protein CASFOL_001252 [Castilleja foliolosa]|uniref:Uncharacterized protein n=1 Tax=Castilleja foliolosa TaxID=1961234 RepID=A0ABD3EQC6_9LAMI